MGLIGNPLNDYVSKQIKIRQDALASGLNNNRTSKENIKKIHPFLTSSPWMRLASGVNVTRSKDDKGNPGVDVIDQLRSRGVFDGVNESLIKGDQLAKNFVLQGGPNSFKGNNPVEGAVNVKTNFGPEADTLNSLKSAYGFGYGKNGINSKQGYVPPPGITDINFEYKNDGALAFADVKIKAFSADQFAMIDILYMRPGYTCLLEFGHSQYLKNDGTLYTWDSSSTIPLDYLFPDSKNIFARASYSEMAKKIAEEKAKHDGNYEGFFGIITKFSWKFNSDGSYDINIKLTGTGNIISSLKSNIGKQTKVPSSFQSNFVFAPTADEAKEQAEEAKENPQEAKKSLVISDANASQLNFELYALFADRRFSSTDEGLIWDSIRESAVFSIEHTSIPIGDKLVSFKNKYSLVKFDVNDWGGTKYSPITLIKFSSFLTMLQKICGITDGQGGSMLNFEIVEDTYNLYAEQDPLTPKYLTKTKKGAKYDSFMVTYPGNFSCDPNVCLINYSSFDPSIIDIPVYQNLPTNTVLNKALNDTAYLEDPSLKNLSNPSLAYPIGDVFVNINFIANTLKDLQGADPKADSSMDISILDLVNSILRGISDSCGNINTFRVIFNENTAQIEIISESPILAPKDKDSNSLTVLNTFGLLPTEGSFVTNFDLDSELSDDMATQISIGAQNNGNQPMSNSTSFSSYNKGLIDRLMVEKKSTINEMTEIDEAVKLATGQISKPGKKDPLLEQWDQSEGSDCFDQVYDDREFNPDMGYIGGLKSISSTFGPGVVGRYTNKKKANVPFFLPFNMSLTMHGLGGAKIYNAFQINGKGLPLSYNPEDIKLIIKSLSHTVNLEGWKTKISTIGFPISKGVTKTKRNFEGKPASNKVVGSSSTVSGDQSNYTTPGITGLFDIDLTRTKNSSSRMKIVNAFGWPITVQTRGDKTYGKKIGDNNGRVVYELDQEYKKRNNKSFSYTFKNGAKYSSKSLHQGIHEPLRKSFKALDNAGIGKAGIKNLSASVYARDTTNAVGLLSGHSFGVAMDFNSSVYGYGVNPYNQYLKDLKNKKSANYKYAKAIQILSKTGLWKWGGDYSSTKDTHHFTFKPYSS